MRLDPKIWGPRYWFTIHNICQNYPLTPNAVTKKKYYDFIQNLPIFLPDHDIGDEFARILDKYPLGPYLETRDALCKWVHFIHNIINKKLNKPIISYEKYILNYQSLTLDPSPSFLKKYIYIIIISLLIIIIISISKK